MKHNLNDKEINSAKYIEYLENVILSADKFLDGMCKCELPAAHPDIDRAVSVIEKNRKPPKPKFPKTELFKEGVKQPEKL